MGGFRRIALHQALQVQRQSRHAVLQGPHRQQGRGRLPASEQLPDQVDPLAGPQGQPRVDLLRVGQLRHQRLQPLFGHQPQRHALDPDQLLDFLLEELGRHAVLALGQHGRVAELAEQNPLRHPADRGVQRLAHLPVQAQGAAGQGALVREDFDAVYG